MDDFTVFYNSFDICLENLTRIFKRSSTNLILNYKKCHFIVEERIILGHVVSFRGLGVYKAKIDIVLSLSYPSMWKVCFVLENTGLYWIFIKDFSKIAFFLYKKLARDASFMFK